ncbi:MAG: hypothetical protein WCU88_01700 [Elusimicrobiota bacterium]|jgi:lycopene cyclase domain-containing protein
MAPEPKASGEEAASPRKLARIPLYLVSIVLAFLLPSLALLGRLWKKASRKALLISVAIIAIIGWSWSWMVSYSHWWTFGERYMLGWQVVPFLPIEEVLFYPLGGLLSILAYLWAYSWLPRKVHAPSYWGFLSLGTLIFAGLVVSSWAYGPYYLLSQLVIYNFACSMLLAPKTASRMNLPALCVPIAGLGVVGYLWNYIGFKYGWWAYYATVRINVSVVPIDDFNFFFFAPTAAVSIYVFVCGLLGEEPIADER